LIVQISYNPEELFNKDFQESLLKITLSGIIKPDLEKLLNISSHLKIKTETFFKTFTERHNFILPANLLEKYLSEIKKAGLLNIFNEISNAFENFSSYDNLSINLAGKNFDEPLIMGILNVTPDSFSDGGKNLEKKDAVKYAVEMFDQGADIVDIGGESTRPGSERISEDQELNRVIPVLEGIFETKPDALISIDTTKSKVAHEACKRGVKIINDISGLTFDSEIAAAANEYSATLVVMHIKGTPETMQLNSVYNDLIFEIYEFLYKQTETAKKYGVQNIIIDPGIGFGKLIEHNFEVLRRLSDFKALGYPILIGLSRKAFLGKTLDLDVKDRDTATVVAETVALKNGAKIIRTHNVLNAVRTRKLLNLIYTE
jgi:dihydropteroate synthase